MAEPVRVSCHCGAVELSVQLSDGLNSRMRCDCSYCRRSRDAVVTVPMDGLEIIRGADKLTLYTWGTHTAKHYFCSVCGCYTHHQRRLNPNEYGVNMGGIEGVNPREHEPIPWTDGVNHPSDRKR